MDWQTFASTFTLIFLAEMGDKTQLAAMSLSAGSRHTSSILAGAMLGIGVATVIGVMAGRLLSGWLNPEWLRIGSGCLFLAFGTLILLDKLPK